MTDMLVTGATGNIGARVVDMLVARGVRPRVLTRAAATITRTDVDVFEGDFAEPASLTKALQATDAVFLVSPADPDQRRLQSGLAQAAAAAGGPRIVKLSGLGTALDSFVDSGRWHAETEQDIVALDLPYTFLRPPFFLQNLAGPIRAAAADGTLRSATPDARIAMLDSRDLAAVIAATLMAAPDRPSEMLTPTGPEAISYRHLAAVIARASGRPVKVLEQSAADQRAGLARAGLPAWRQDNLLQFSHAFDLGWGAAVTDVVERLTGAPPRTVAAFVRECLTA